MLKVTAHLSRFLPVQLYNFLGYLMDNFTPSSNERKISLWADKPHCPSVKLNPWVWTVVLTFPPGNLISHIFRENEVCRDAEWERYFCYKNIEVPEIYSGPHLTFPLTVEQAVGLVEAFRNKKVGARSPVSEKPSPGSQLLLKFSGLTLQENEGERILHF